MNIVWLDKQRKRKNVLNVLAFISFIVAFVLAILDVEFYWLGTLVGVLLLMYASEYSGILRGYYKGYYDCADHEKVI